MNGRAISERVQLGYPASAQVGSVTLAVEVQAARVGSFKPNALGFYDLSGNAAEWMWDGLDEKTGSWVNRGGGWGYAAAGYRAAYCFRSDPGRRDSYLGLRPALVPSP